MKTAVVYARFSCNKQREASIEDQLRVCKTWCQENGYEIVAEYCDHSISGRTDDRPEFLRMIANAGESDIVLVYMMDRFSRDEYDAPIYKKKLKDVGVRVVSATELIPDCPEAVLIEKVYEGIAAVESIHISQRTKRGMHGNALKCMHNGVNVFGYRFADDGGYDIDEVEASLVREAFSRRIAGEAVNSIAVDFARRGVKSYRGLPCGHTMVRNILRNEKYTGVYKFGEVRIVGGMPQIIDEETFLRAQVAKSGKIRKDESWGEFPLSGRAVCTGCGRSLRGVSGRGRHNVKYEYYRCSKKDCEVKPVRADWLEGSIVDFIRGMLSDRETALGIAAGVEKAINDDAGNDRMRRAVERRIKDAKTGIDNLIDAITKGLDATLVTDKIEDFQHQIDVATRELEIIDRSETFDADDFVDFLQHGANLTDDKLLDAFVYQVHVGVDDVTVILNYHADKGKPATIDLQRVRPIVTWLPG